MCQHDNHLKAQVAQFVKMSANKTHFSVLLFVVVAGRDVDNGVAAVVAGPI